MILHALIVGKIFVSMGCFLRVSSFLGAAGFKSCRASRKYYCTKDKPLRSGVDGVHRCHTLCRAGTIAALVL